MAARRHDTLIGLRQSEELPAEAREAPPTLSLAAAVIAERPPTVRWDFLERSAVLDLPFRDLASSL